MFESFVNPGYLLAGLALISLPIIIHLINRMRFKRVRWAAMEFLLKSQKRNRRRLIIEQLILLALRCLLVFLAVLLVSRYLGLSFAMFEPQNTLHVVVLDDTLSMSDHHRDDGEERTCFKTARELIVREIARNAAQARTAQRLVLVLLSDTARRPFDQRLNDQSIQELQKALDDLACSDLRVDLTHGVAAAAEILGQAPQDRRILHVVSDFRSRDWGEPEGEALSKALDELGRAKVQINLIDAAHPYRTEQQRTPLYHDNLAIVDLRPETRVAAQDLPVQFTVAVANFGTGECRNLRVAMKVNGGQRLEGDVNIESIPPGQTREEKLQLSFGQLGFNQVSANIENEETGLAADNVRYAVVEIRKQVPILIVDGDPTNGVKLGGDTFHVQTLLTAARGYQTFTRGVLELEQPNLDQYASIYLLNVREISDKGLKNLESYVREGGSVAFFLGERVRPDFYNEKLYRKGQGIFPAPLADRPYPPLSEEELKPDLLDGQLKMFVREEKHPIFAELWDPKYRAFYKFLSIKRYFPVRRREWEKDPGRVEELVTLPNNRSMRDYAGQAQAIVDSLNAALGDPKCEKYSASLKQHQRQIHDLLLTDKPLYELADALEALLKGKDPTETGDQSKDRDAVRLADFWKLPEYQTLYGRIDRFREDVRLGDPLVISELLGKGRVVAYLTTAGLAWNDWASNFTYPGMMVELQKFLTSGGGDSNRIVGTPLDIDVDGVRHDTRLRAFYQPESRDSGPAAEAPKTEEVAKTGGPVDRGEFLGTETAGRVHFLFDGARKPGLYRFEIGLRNDKPGAEGENRADQKAYVFNVDPAESDLRRANRDGLEKIATGARLRNPSSGWGAELANKQNDLSESAWFYLLFLVILVLEQALAVHLSFHLKGSEMPAAGRQQRPQHAAA
jgi:Aerotolerance regulator N-terminal